MTVQSTDLLLPTQIADGIVEKAKTSSTIAALSAQEPQRFGKVEIITFDDDLTAEFVEEIAPKGSDEAKPDSVQAVPHKAVVQMRTSDEFKWADEDYKLNIFKKYEEKCARALARALDLGLYYRINPRTGNALTAWTNYLNATTKRVEITATSQPDLDFEVAAGLVIEDGYSVNGVAFDPKYAWKLATARFPDGRKKFPELGLGEGISSFEGVSAAVSSTVSGKAKDGDATDNKVRAILGNFRSGIRWGVQREFPFKILEYGDPDNKGRDLAGHNEILLRTEIVYGWYVFDGEFAVIEDAVTP
ncbi:phage major capsid family protein [Mycobacteroides abscessus]|uniref:phage major capsid family protein n=1 Tax=Mycobacteroides abscessus TaxID=36809 RepID=UPI0009A82531|nr:phage major capsid protein [Mycobacteroides abscessus]SKF90684.1 Phage capsid family [Mycobacteroides abscessus subsp. bolletii]SKG25758.1 Phage capsid family [Mycobacteroides abscessus subsp. bolletii]SKH28073.1 Phage capsid family [Mycobacteroides abscessus subsp. bolletii]SKH59091.1 Phage capsid family [Mycobacteroides abscessus subsp. bolletii]SKH90248.1 Phage capsid family [Mycobacteroides abscessus subsp. bolletii]